MAISALSPAMRSAIITMLRGTDTGCGRDWNMILTSVSSEESV